MKTTLKTLFLALSICGVRVALSADIGLADIDFNDPIWTEQYLYSELDKIMDAINALFKTISNVESEVKPRLEELQAYKARMRYLEDLRKRATSRLFELRRKELGLGF